MDETKVPNTPIGDSNVSFDTLEDQQRKQTEKETELENMRLAIAAHVPSNTLVRDMDSTRFFFVW